MEPLVRPGPIPVGQARPLGGYRPKKICGKLDCASAKRAIDKGGHVKHRVFFLDEKAALECGYRPCAKCMPEAYLAWKQSQSAQVSPPRTRRKIQAPSALTDRVRVLD